jgi:hypothetical protein
MPFFALYLVKLSICLGLAWLFYQVFLRRLTFYNWNRWYLLGYSLLSFLIPLIDLHAMVDSDRLEQPAVIRYIPVIGNYSPFGQFTPASGRHAALGLSAWALCFFLLALGSTFFIVKLLIRWLALRKVRQQATLIGEAAAKVRIYQVDRPIVPFSFGNAVYANQRLHTEKEWEEIILHEFVHIRQRHTVDILVAELLCALNWFNPFAWLIRFSIRQNLEFIADRKVLENGVDRKNYQYHLLKVIGQPRYRLANNFNFSSLKKRIAMMNKIQSARLQLIKFLFMLPLLATLLVAFRGQYEGIFKKYSGPLYVNAAGIIVDIRDYSPLAAVIIKDAQTGLSTTTDEHGFYKLRLPVPHDTFRMQLELSKEGFEKNSIRYYNPKITEPRGAIQNGYLLKNGSSPSFYLFMGFDGSAHQPLDPSYEDAKTSLLTVRRMNDDMGKYLALQKAHPEVSLFYTTEDHLKHIVFYQDGHFEKYGYPGGLAVADMEAKFGMLPDMIKGRHGSAGGYYVQQWAKISADAEKEFHSDNPNARHIVFPGDSRVIVVPVSGKPRVYDMDNNRDDKERPAFEREYGKLPACVPEPDKPEPRESQPGKPAPAKPEISLKEQIRTDTVPINTDASKDGPHSPAVMPRAVRSITDSVQPQPLWVVDGKETDPASVRNISPNTILSIRVFKPSFDSLITIYGNKAKNGVIIITTKGHAPDPGPGPAQHTRVVTPNSSLVGPVHVSWTGARQMPRMILGENPDSKHLYLLNGEPIHIGTDMGKVLRSDNIAFMESSEDEPTLKKFGGYAGQMLMNIITRPNENNPAARVLSYAKNDESH